MFYAKELEKYNIETFGEAGEDNVLVFCPFHDDDNPSGEIQVVTGLFYCFSCGYGCRFPKFLAEALCIPVDEAETLVEDALQIEYVIKNMSDLMFADMIKEKRKPVSRRWFKDTFRPVVGTPGEDYLRSRGITRKAMQYFNIRFGEHDEWCDRVILPIHRWNGQIVSWVGRTINGHPVKTRKPFSARFTLYGLYQVLRRMGVKRQPYLILVEGEIDALWMQICGFRAVSPMGTAKLTDDQKALLYRFADKAIFAYDADEAGIKSSVREDGKCKEFLPSYRIRLPRDRDPNDLKKSELRKIFLNNL